MISEMVDPLDIREASWRKKINAKCRWGGPDWEERERNCDPGQDCGVTSPPERRRSSPRLCVARQRQAGCRAVSKGRAQPGGAAGG